MVREPNFLGRASMPPHDGPWAHLVDVPLVLYGPGVVRARGTIDDPASIVDLAPTTAAMIGFDEWPRRAGRVLDEALAPGARPPRLVVTVVWDGAGDNVLRAHPDAWPYLRRLMRGGVSYREMTVGSTPSNTPPVHTSLGAGTFPRRHGIVSVSQRTEAGEVIDPWENEDPSRLETTTLADLYDRSRDNAAQIGVVGTTNWHLGMIGHGSALEGGDSDMAALLMSGGGVFGNPAYYDLPDISGGPDLARYVRQTDSSDGRLDGQWRGNSLEDLAVLASSPPYAAWQADVIEELIVDRGFGADETPDLLYVNFKQPDSAGHKWGMSSPEVGDAVAAADKALRNLVGELNRTVGRGRWALMVTADHGQKPYPQDSGAFAIKGSELKAAIDAEFDRTDDGIDLVDRVTSSGVALNVDQLEPNRVTLEEIAEWLSRYTLEVAFTGGGSPPDYVEAGDDEPLFDAIVINGGRAVMNC